MKFKQVDFIVLSVIAALGCFVTIGFFRSDPFLYHRFGKNILLLLWAIRIGVPLAFLGLMLAVIYIRLGRLKIQNMLLTVVTLVAGVIALFTAGNIIYQKKLSIATISGSYHPYLQLKPAIPADDRLDHLSDTAAISVFCLGGSTTEFKDKKNIGWPEKTQMLLNTGSSGKNACFYNFGRQWYTSLHTLINYEANLRHLHPDVIIVMHSINDLLHNADESYFSHGKFREDYGHFYGPVNRLIAYRSLLKEIGTTMQLWYYKPRRVLELTGFPGLVPFERNLNTLIDLAQKDSVRVVLLTQPTLLKKEMKPDEQNVLHMVNVETCGSKTQWSYKTAWRGMVAYNNKVREIAKKRNVYLIDLDSAIPGNLTFFWDDVHYTDTTFSLIAGYIAGQMEQQKIFDDCIRKKK